MATLTPLPLPQSFEDFCALFLLFIAYSTLGWCGEMIYCSVPKGRLCEKRGFLNGFLCPIYGHGALLVLYALRGGFRNPFLTFLFGALLTSALEYFTSWVMEKLFHMRWWDSLTISSRSTAACACSTPPASASPAWCCATSFTHGCGRTSSVSAAR